MGRQLKNPDLGVMVAIAAGTAARVDGWAAILSRASVPCAVARCCEFDPLAPDYAELWVHHRDASAARKALWRVNTDG